ncbi:hypothetical protein EDC22_1061, partial [Tepidamorphus gemmatus]
MLGLTGRRRRRDAELVMQALRATRACIEFAPDGTILDA